MNIGNVIRKQRKELKMTQEEMANRLGVTAPAVNKWENNNTLPDITLLAPIARLLGITVDELLSFKEELTTKEIDQFSYKILKDLKEKDYDTVFTLAKSKIEEYPNCIELILEMANVLDPNHFLTLLRKEEIPNKEQYENTIIGWYEQALQSENEKFRNAAAISLFFIYLFKEDYEMALHYTKYISSENTTGKSYEAMVYSKNGEKDKAYEIYEKLILRKLFGIHTSLMHLCRMYMEDENHEMAHKLVDISSTVTKAFEVEKLYEGMSMKLSVASWEKDIAKTEQAMRSSLDNIVTDPMSIYKKSSLYKHITFNDSLKDLGVNPESFKKDLGIDPESLRKRVIAAYKDKKFDYMRGNEWYEKLISSEND